MLHSLGAVSRVLDLDAQTAHRRRVRVGRLFPVGLDLDLFVFQPDFVRKAIDDFMVNLVMAFVFVVGAMFVFTGLRTGIVAGLVIPVSILTCT